MSADPSLNRLIEKARCAGGHKTKKAAISAALQEYVKRLSQQDIVKAFGTFDFDPAYDYKAERERAMLAQASIRKLRGKVKWTGNLKKSR
jgi:hypothetical protein